MSPLELHIRRLIERHGPLTVAEYMALALGHPEHGYYQRRDPFGRDGDFITAPEISQMFGELIGAWCIEAWQAMGGGAFQLVELGSGRGTLLRDLLRMAGKLRPEFMRAATVHLVETSPALRAMQADLLGEFTPVWHDSLDALPQAPSLFVLNEFLDALPVRQFVLTQSGLCERRVGLAGDGFQFLVERAPRVPTEALSPDVQALPLGSMVETCPAALAIVSDMASRIAGQGGTALIVDYGFAEPEGEDTFQAVRGHAFADPLAAPGEADLTAHVDFRAIARVAAECGASVQGPVGQGEFLTALGIQHRAATLAAAGDTNALAALERLVQPEQMGELFKVLVLTAK